ncbi:MAG: hypothetical protein ACODAC_12055, partial [Pseudomonadota bacterium]
GRGGAPAAPAADPAPRADAPDGSGPEAKRRHYLLAVNLYNQFNLTHSRRAFERARLLELAGAVADLYGGRAVALPGVGALVDFDAGDDDRPFQVLCAAFVLARLLHEQGAFGTYRLGLDLADRHSDAPPAPDDPAVVDAALLSALARDTSVAVSAPYARALEPHHHMIETRPLTNPLLDDLNGDSNGCCLVVAVAEALTPLIREQADQLAEDRDTTSSPSTF